MSNKIDNAFYLCIRQLFIRLKHKHNRCRCRFFIFLVKAVFRQDDMNSCFLNNINLFNRSSQFTLQSLKIIYFVLKFCNAELAVVEKFKTFIATRKTVCRQFKSNIMNLSCRNINCSSAFVFFNLITDPGLFKTVHHVAGIFCF